MEFYSAKARLASYFLAMHIAGYPDNEIGRVALARVHKELFPFVILERDKHSCSGPSKALLHNCGLSLVLISGENYKGYYRLTGTPNTPKPKYTVESKGTIARLIHLRRLMGEDVFYCALDRLRTLP